MADEQVRSQFRISESVYAWLKERAKRDHRSINGQLNAELESRMKQEQEKAA
ncbi:Arc family DNA-binding protein [Stenotrophomonas sp. STM01]|uniref:Arc family DNA-binding protein n=1 Tax=Stenotrophomonas sp. STM01 TaxID=2769278 RepID=UPI001785017C|nr:Arc family DNA-binding protein [Stenotrophomonas sp. STM01]MBD9534635.1 Arc family DNA-binding protein [Stenotrophomonas sp. STM01]